MPHVVVIGSGITGVTSAYELAQLGYEVTVIDKHLFPAMETSFAMVDSFQLVMQKFGIKKLRYLKGLSGWHKKMRHYY